jgi:hypothetical protein
LSDVVLPHDRYDERVTAKKLNPSMHGKPEQDWGLDWKWQIRVFASMRTEVPIGMSAKVMATPRCQNSGSRAIRFTVSASPVQPEKSEATDDPLYAAENVPVNLARCPFFTAAYAIRAEGSFLASSAENDADPS